MSSILEVSKPQIKEQLKLLLSDPTGVLVLLAGGLMISDFEDPEEALEEALKAFNGNRAYFDRLMKKAPKRL
ncbi:MAG: hypothetical protein A2508_09160 [Candidatus Lambdaproteobacteria bacterium RIFOXYD12_FULL_49_8]|uniref:Uncharacterized protein n=1 Tax=Candidatus Lambdaproteobacteria bacterium RIFOXYD2_FULL_50_16 TaxID=1817772 RepID=A0A1F6GGG0_9PROT|nr:MAG: hypothetical protein A2527_10220 [Candidatus Lambdaproteobacteria bacterium RIFOXYD2_FULL_50_16]OGG97625.1 MAG: hypothetical protein A2508_09160 [Candidatus Lambdaproteobacteria bacterium RIFOXYD12_FULL_49_8]